MDEALSVLDDDDEDGDFGDGDFVDGGEHVQPPSQKSNGSCIICRLTCRSHRVTKDTEILSMDGPYDSVKRVLYFMLKESVHVPHISPNTFQVAERLTNVMQQPYLEAPFVMKDMWWLALSLGWK